MSGLASLEEVRGFMERVTYPINKRTLLETAREGGESERMLRTIEGLPDESWHDHSGLHADLERVVRSG